MNFTAHTNTPVNVQDSDELVRLGGTVQSLVDLRDDPVKEARVDSLDQGVPSEAGLEMTFHKIFFR